MVRSQVRSARAAAQVAVVVLLAPLLLAGAPGAGVHAQVTLPEGVGSNPLVREITFDGVSAVSESDLGAALETRATRCRNLLFKPFCLVSDGDFFEIRTRLDPEELQADLIRIRVFYWLRGYRDAGVTAEVRPREDGEDGEVTVAFTVEEGPPTVARTVEVVQDPALLTERDILLARLPDEGEPVDMLRLRLAASLLRDDLLDLGYADAAVRDTVLVDSTGTDGPPTARVRLVVEPGRLVTIGAVEVVGNEEVSDRTVQRLVALHAGQLYHQDDLEEAQRRLFASGLFRRSVVQGDWSEAVGGLELPGAPEGTQTAMDSARAVGARLAETLPDTARPVVVSVIEAPDHEVEVGAGVSTVEFVQLQARHTRYNFLGGARRLDLSGSLGNLFASQLYDRSIFTAAVPEGVAGEPEPAFLDPTWSLSLGFTQPWFLSSRNQLGLSVGASRRVVPGVVVDRTTSGGASITRTVAEGVDLSLEYRFERTRVEAGDVYFCVNFGVCQPSTIETVRRARSLSPLRLSGLATRVEEPLNPVAGYTARADLEHASTLTGSDYGYTRLSGEATKYRRAGQGVLAGRLRAGWVTVGGGDEDVLHPRKRFFAGGARSVRGYTENQLGPRILTVPAAALMQGGEEGPGCTEAEVADGSCDPSAVPLDAFAPRPLGGDVVVEGSLEYRFPIFGLAGAAFVDAAWVGDRDLNVPSGPRAAVTPGFGVRYPSPVGMIRVDLGIRPTLTEDLPVVTRVPGEDDLVTLATLRRYDPVEGSGSFFRQVLERLVLHLSIGEAF